jgi:hypothetical protein
MTHRIANNGVCRRCGEFRATQLAEACAPRVVYSAARNTVIDYITPGGVTFYGHKTLAECQAETPDAVVMDADAAFTLYESGFVKPPVEITEERFHDATYCPHASGRGGQTESSRVRAHRRQCRELVCRGEAPRTPHTRTHASCCG